MTDSPRPPVKPYRVLKSHVFSLDLLDESEWNEEIELVDAKAFAAQVEALQGEVENLALNLKATIEQRDALKEDLDRLTRGTWSMEIARRSKMTLDLRTERDALQAKLAELTAVIERGEERVAKLEARPNSEAALKEARGLLERFCKWVEGYRDPNVASGTSIIGLSNEARAYLDAYLDRTARGDPQA
jgi:small-conductance mechanosensitive channel